MVYFGKKGEVKTECYQKDATDASDFRLAAASGGVGFAPIAKKTLQRLNPNSPRNRQVTFLLLTISEKRRRHVMKALLDTSRVFCFPQPSFGKVPKEGFSRVAGGER